MSKPWICIDLDGTIAPHPTDWDKGFYTFLDPFPQAKKFLEILSQKFRIMIFTCRAKRDISGMSIYKANEVITGWLDEHGLKYDDVYFGQGKPDAVAYIDDKGINCRPSESGEYAAYSGVLLDLGLDPRDG